MNAVIIISLIVAVAFVIVCVARYIIVNNSVELTPDSPFFNDEIDDEGADKIQFKK